jgi:hypothetical protein
MSRRQMDQPDLFGPAAAPVAEAMPEVDEAFMASIRAELGALLAKAEGAERLPWRDFTASALAEIRFDGLLRWLPSEEAAPLAERFAAALDRLYAAG